MDHLPDGTVTFMFTDIEGSTRHWEEHPDAIKTKLIRHDAIVKESVASNNGHIVKTIRDGIHAVFSKA